MNKDKLEKNLEELETIIGQIYVDQMVRKDYVITPSIYRRIGVIFKDIYWEVDKLESEDNEQI